MWLLNLCSLSRYEEVVGAVEWEERKRARRTCNRGKNNEHLDRRGKGESEKDNGKYSSPFFKKLVLVNYITIYLNLSIFLSNNSTN